MLAPSKLLGGAAHPHPHPGPPSSYAYVMIIYADLSFNPTMHNKVMVRTRTGFIEVPTVTLTFGLAIWFLFPTHRLVMMIICAPLFLNPTMHNKVMGRT